MPKVPGASAFKFWPQRTGEQEAHVVIVHGRGDLKASYNLASASLVVVPYTSGGWREFERDACAAIGMPADIWSAQVFLDEMFVRSKASPVVVYVENAQLLSKHDGGELVRYVAYWERVAHDALVGAYPMYLALEFPREDE